MSREIILGLAEGIVDERSPSFRAFLCRLGENVGKFKPEWMEGLSGSAIVAQDPEDDEDGNEDALAVIEPKGWMFRAVLSVLAQMCAMGPEGGLPPVQAICRAMLAKECHDKCHRTDEDWMLYFLKTFHRVQKKYLLEVLGEGGGAELRRRLMKALKQSGIQLLESGQKEVDVAMVANSIGTREAAGNSRNHAGGMPTVVQLREMIRDVVDLVPGQTPSFPNWMGIASRVFSMGSSQSPQGGIGSDVDEGRNRGLVSDDDPEGPGWHGEWQASHADVSEVCALVEETIAELDQEPFPEGLHGRTFVEFLLFADRAGTNRVTQEEYAKRTGVSDGTVAYRRDAIFKALRKNQLGQFDHLAICEAFRQMQATYLGRHLEIFGD